MSLGCQFPEGSPLWVLFAPESLVCRAVRGMVLSTGLLNDQLHQLAPITSQTLSTGNVGIQGDQPIPGRLSPDEDQIKPQAFPEHQLYAGLRPAQGKALLHSLIGPGGGGRWVRWQTQ